MLSLDVVIKAKTNLPPKLSPRGPGVTFPPKPAVLAAQTCSPCCESVQEHKVLLTGTPLQNSVEELFSLLNFLEPSQFPSETAFLEEFGDLKTEEQVNRGLKDWRSHGDRYLHHQGKNKVTMGTGVSQFSHPW